MLRLRLSDSFARLAPAGTSPFTCIGADVSHQMRAKYVLPGVLGVRLHQMQADVRQAGVSPPTLERLHPSQTKEDRV